MAFWGSFFANENLERRPRPAESGHGGREVSGGGAPGVRHRPELEEPQEITN